MTSPSDIRLGDSPRSTGPRSQQNHIVGHAKDIAEQLTGVGRIITWRMVIQAIAKEMSEDGEWPGVRVGRTTVLVDWTLANSEQANALIMGLHRFSEIYGLYVTDYGEDGPAVRTIGGVHEMSDVQG